MPTKSTDIRPISARLHLLPVQTRLPYKFGAETMTQVTCARVCLRVTDRQGRQAEGWGEGPLNGQWAWPGSLSYQERYEAMESFCHVLVKAYGGFTATGHVMEVGHAFLTQVLPSLLEQFNRGRGGHPAMPYLAALVCCAPFDVALHDAYGMLHGVGTYDTYNAQWMSQDLSAMLQPASDGAVNFAGKFPQDYLRRPRLEVVPAWHSVGERDWLEETDVDGTPPADNHPHLLRQWIRRDGLKCLKIKLCGQNSAWDYQRVVRIGQIGNSENVDWLCTDFNCTASDVGYVNEILDCLMVEHPRIYGMILYVEQPFPYDLEKHRMDVHSLAARKPLFMDESAHDWRLVQLGRSLGWTGVALKTCKTQTGALLSLCWAKAHGMTLMVQDLSNPMLAHIPHVLLAAHAGTIMGLESNSMQYYPEASRPEALVHPGLYARRNGTLNLQTVQGPGLGYQLHRIVRVLPVPED